MEEARADAFEPRARGRILIVDDEPSVCSGLEELLASRGHGTACATSPYRALQLLDEFDPDLVLTDLRMPGLDGLSFMDQARQTQPDRVGIIMTAHSVSSLAVEAGKREPQRQDPRSAAE